MILGRAYGTFSTVLGTMSVGAAAVRDPIAPVSPLTEIPGIGAVPLFPIAVGVLTALLVRVVVMTSTPGKLWTYNLAVTGLAMIGTATFIIDHQVGPGSAFWVGSGFGAVGVGVIQIAKSKLFSTVLDAAKAGLQKGLDEQ